MSNNKKRQQSNTYRSLSEEESRVMLKKGTELAWTGKYTGHKKGGTYICKQCGATLYWSEYKFDSQCGWPSFDDEINGAVLRVPDDDGVRTEIICANCKAHLGHVFAGEGYTEKNIRHCVNSVSLDFVPARLTKGIYETAVFAGGCFWGVEYYLKKHPGVVAVISGYTGGTVKNPSYEKVCTGTTGHAEAVRAVYDPGKTNYEKMVRLFLEIHDPTQVDRQGPDIGSQYRSEIFYLNDKQKTIAKKCLDILKNKGYEIATKLTPASEFYDAENYHQDYYFRKGSTPYCHGYVKRFED